MSPLPELPSFGQLYQAHLELEHALKQKLQSQNGQKVYEVLELPLATVLYEMEQKGVMIDSDELRRQSLEIGKDITAMFTGAMTPELRTSMNDPVVRWTHLFELIATIAVLLLMVFKPF